MFNLAGPDFAKFVRQHVAVVAATTIVDILDGVGNSLRPKCFDLQNHEKLFSHKQSQVSVAKFLEELRDLYDSSNYGVNITRVQYYS